jgi:tetratricopeptide (TPR) repeat protein
MILAPRRLALPLGLLTTVTLLTTGCGTTQFMVTRRAPAEVDLAPGKLIAVAAIDGEGGDALVSELTQALVETKRFEVLERQNLDAAMKELKFSSEHASDETAISFGKMTGAANLVAGVVSGADYREDVTTENQECPKPDGTVAPCVRHTRTAVADYRVTLKVIETETGKLLAAKNLDAKEARAVATMDAPPPELNVKNDLLRACRADIVGRFIRAVAPYEKQVMVSLLSDDDLPELEPGNNYARIGNWGAALEQYRAALARAESTNAKPALKAMALYDIGVALAYSGSYAEGIASIEKAYALDPSYLYEQQLAEVRKLAEEDARLKQQESKAE